MHYDSHASVQRSDPPSPQLNLIDAIDLLYDRQRYLELLQACGHAAAREVSTHYGYEGADRPKHRLVPLIPREELEAWNVEQRTDDAFTLYHRYRRQGPLFSTRELRTELESDLSALEAIAERKIVESLREKDWENARTLVESLEHLHAPPELALLRTSHESIDPHRHGTAESPPQPGPPEHHLPEPRTGETPRADSPGLHSTDGVPSTSKKDHGLFHKAWTSSFAAAGKLLGITRQEPAPIWWRTIATPPTFEGSHVQHGMIFGSGMEIIEQASVGVADLLKGLGAGIAASWISVPLELGWSWFWEGSEGAKRSLEGCAHDHGPGEHHHHLDDHDHHHHHGDHDHAPHGHSKKPSFAQKFAEKWHDRGEEVSAACTNVHRALSKTVNTAFDALLHPVKTFHSAHAFLQSREAREEYRNNLTESATNFVKRAAGIATPVLGHKLFDGTGIVLGHLAFASIGLPPWIGAMVGNVLFSMPYHVLSATLRERYRRIAESDAAKAAGHEHIEQAHDQ